MSGKHKSVANKISSIGLCIAAIGYGIGMYLQAETGAIIVWLGALVVFFGILRVWFDIFWGSKE